MAFKDWAQPMWDKIKARSPFAQDDMTSNMANGGFSGYKPNTAKHRVMRETAQQAPVQDTQQIDPTMAGMNWAQPQQAEQPMGFGGYTSAVPPQATGYQQTTGYQQATGYQYTQGTGYQQPMGGWQNQQPGMDAMGGAYAQPHQPYGNTTTFPPVQPNAQQTAYQSAAAPLDNISYMPGNFVGEDGKAYSHCERIALINNVSMCYRIVEFMRNGESVIVSTEQITDEDENQRCLDLLYGAAFAMNCSFTKVSGKSIYLIAPAAVMVIPYLAVRQFSDQDMNARWPDPERESPRRSRSEDRFAPFGQGYGRHESRPYARRDYGYQNDYNPYGYSAVGYGR